MYAIHGGIGWSQVRAAIQGLSSEESLNGIPATFEGSLDVAPTEGALANLQRELMVLATKYGFAPHGSVVGHRALEIQVYCGGNFVAGVITARDGELVLFQSLPYGFRLMEHYHRFNNELTATLGRYGKVRDVRQSTPLSKEELDARGIYMQRDVRSQCSPIVPAA